MLIAYLPLNQGAFSIIVKAELKEKFKILYFKQILVNNSNNEKCQSFSFFPFIAGT